MLAGSRFDRIKRALLSEARYLGHSGERKLNSRGERPIRARGALPLATAASGNLERKTRLELATLSLEG
jgi:hypothetical protein